MSKHKNKKNRTATPKEPITRRDLCVRICDLQQKIYTLRQINTSLTNSALSYKNRWQETLKLAEEAVDKLERMAKLVRHYKITTSIAILALILSGLSHLIYLYI